MIEVYDALMAPLENLWLAKHLALLMDHGDGYVIEKYKLAAIESGTFADGIFLCGVVKKPSGGQ